MYFPSGINHPSFSPCPGCREAAKNPRTHVLYAHCDECDARALAVSRIYEQSATAGHITTEYRNALGRVFGDRWKAGHEMVKRWAKRMKESA